MGRKKVRNGSRANHEKRCETARRPTRCALCGGRIQVGVGKHGIMGRPRKYCKKCIKKYKRHPEVWEHRRLKKPIYKKSAPDDLHLWARRQANKIRQKVFGVRVLTQGEFLNMDAGRLFNNLHRIYLKGMSHE